MACLKIIQGWQLKPVQDLNWVPQQYEISLLVVSKSDWNFLSCVGTQILGT
jgi:hypothetical protein